MRDEMLAYVSLKGGLARLVAQVKVCAYFLHAGLHTIVKERLVRFWNGTILPSSFERNDRSKLSLV